MVDIGIVTKNVHVPCCPCPCTKIHLFVISLVVHFVQHADLADHTALDQHAKTKTRRKPRVTPKAGFLDYLCVLFYIEACRQAVFCRDNRHTAKHTVICQRGYHSNTCIAVRAVQHFTQPADRNNRIAVEQHNVVLRLLHAPVTRFEVAQIFIIGQYGDPRVAFPRQRIQVLPGGRLRAVVVHDDQFCQRIAAAFQHR